MLEKFMLPPGMSGPVPIPVPMSVGLVLLFVFSHLQRPDERAGDMAAKGSFHDFVQPFDPPGSDFWFQGPFHLRSE